ncbi:MAG TPA: DUF2845 domain-containing protein [Nevskiaceae bacterium]|nr:DUF2845 domain-containing protein [Nevskiaceae bacterium]
MFPELETPVTAPWRRRSVATAAWAFAWLGAVLGTAFPLPATASLQCGGRIVSVGATMAEVEARCGVPAFRDPESYALPRGRGLADDSELWTYNFGPNRLLQILRFRDGRLQDIRSDGYGFAGPAQGRCNPYDIHSGMSEYQLLWQCGPPTERHASNVLVPLVEPFSGQPVPVRRPPNGVYAAVEPYQRQVYRERWLYNFGPRYLMRRITLEDGRVTSVDTTSRHGFDD